MTPGAGQCVCFVRLKLPICPPSLVLTFRRIPNGIYHRRVDELLVTEAWKKQKEIAAREGVVAIAYERKYGEYSRIYQMAKLMLWTSGAGLYSCPIAMTGTLAA